MRKTIFKFFAAPLVTVYLGGLLAYCILQLQLPNPLWFSEFEAITDISIEHLLIALFSSIGIYSIFLLILKPSDLYEVTG